jgi:hypothetical protein
VDRVTPKSEAARAFGISRLPLTVYRTRERTDFPVAGMYDFANRASLACGMIPNEEYHALAR